ncbi:hypothetical protein, partial [Priestia megaterium]|uniref:hypothetical protein n=1 Tax=Priestia megaterium TaxID=1404 RepID=UPI0035B5C105
DLTIRMIAQDLTAAAARLGPVAAGPVVAGRLLSSGAPGPIHSPADHRRLVGHVIAASPADSDAAFAAEKKAQPQWDALGG